MVVPGGGGREENECFMGTESQFGKTERVTGQTVVTDVRLPWTCFTPLSRPLKTVKNIVMYV